MKNEQTVNEIKIEKVPKIFDDAGEVEVMEREDLEMVEGLVRLAKKFGSAGKSLYV